MMMDIDPEVFLEYIAETDEALGGLDEKFVELEKHPDDVKIIDSIFRPVHSIKGSSAFFAMDHVTSFAHKLENLLDDLRKGKKKVTPIIIDNLLMGTDFLKAMFDRVSAGDTNYELTPEEKQFIETLDERISKKKKGAETEDIDYYLFKMKDLISSMRSKEYGSDQLIDELEKNLTKARGIVGKLEDMELDSDEIPKLGEILIETGKVEAEQLADALGKQEKVGEILIKKGIATEEMIEEAVVKQKEKAQEIVKTKMAVKKTMRIEEERVDEFMNQIGELVIVSEVFNYLEKRLGGIEGASVISKEFKNANLSFSELTFRLQHGLSEVRKVSIKGIFQKIPRLVRDLSTSLGKNIEIELTGDDLTLDKSMLEKLESPMIHMVRNAVDHGIEMPDIRESRGKPKIGKVYLSASIADETLTLTLKDDGGGLPREKLLEKGVSKGIISQAEADSMPDKEIFALIFHPGFSTAAKVTDVSGRGVGMDVVKSAITEMKGKIDIDSVEGEGSTFSIILPVATTLVTINGMVVAVGKGKFIFPVEDVKESIRPTKKEIFAVKEDKEMLNIRGNIYPLIRLYSKYSISGSISDPTEGVGIIIEKKGRHCCVMADSIVEQQNVVLKDLGKVFRGVKSILGGAILGDGSIGLVVNVEALMDEN